MIRMSDLLEPLLAVTTITAVITAVVSGFWKLFLSAALEKFKGEVTNELERLKNQLSKEKETFMLVYKHQFEVEFKAYQEIWLAVQEMKIAVNRLLMSTHDDETYREAKENWEQLFERNYLLFERFRPFYSADIYALLQEYHGLGYQENHIAVSIKISREPFSEIEVENQNRIHHDFGALYHRIAEAIRVRVDSMRVVGAY